MLSPNVWIWGVYLDHPNVRLLIKKCLIRYIPFTNKMKKECGVYHAIPKCLDTRCVFWPSKCLSSYKNMSNTFKLLPFGIKLQTLFKWKMFRLETMKNNASSTYMCEWAKWHFPANVDLLIHYIMLKTHSPPLFWVSNVFRSIAKK